MATFDITSNSIGTGLRVSMTAGQSAKVFAGISVQRTDTDGPAIVAFESNSAVELLGSVEDSASNFAAILLGNDVDQTNNSLTVGVDGSVTGRTQLMSHSSSISNAGTMDGILIYSEDNGGFSTLENSGEISESTAIQRMSGSDEELRVTNTGTIQGDGFAFFSFAKIKAVDVIANSGLIHGDVMLGGGDDSYDGTGGKLAGLVDAGTGDDTLIGGGEVDSFKGGKGDDTLEGAGGRDILKGELGADTLTGGAGRDSFIFVKSKESTNKAFDTITDYSRKNRDDIQLFLIDANGSKAGNGEFDFIGKSAFSGENGELRYQVKGGDTFVYGDTNGDEKADFAIKFDDVIKFNAGDFAL